ncbi:MAG: hypothetical protein F6K42_23660 [Leptolyngbya sp. SIO1D8]|nr:hypothetical protein [Leptolyngbya sp. SIO1D8]
MNTSNFDPNHENPARLIDSLYEQQLDPEGDLFDHQVMAIIQLLKTQFVSFP